MSNPYLGMETDDLHSILVGINAEWRDCVSKQQEVSQWARTIQENRGQLLQAMGVSVAPWPPEQASYDWDSDPLATPIRPVTDWPTDIGRDI